MVASQKFSRPKRLRNACSIGLVIVGALSALVGGVALYAREEIIDNSAFADRAVDALHQPKLQRVVAREVTVQLIEPGIPDVVAGRPVIESAVRVVIGSEAFSGVLRLAAEHGHRLLFERKAGNVLFDIADAGTVVSSALRNLAPRVAQGIPPRAQAVLLTLRKRSFATQTLRVADHVRVLGLVLPVLALVLLSSSLLIAPDRRRAITRGGLAIGITGIVFAVAFELMRRYVVSHVYGTQELTNADVRGAVDELWGAYLDDLFTWALVLSGGALVVAAASASRFAAYSPLTGLRRLGSAVTAPLPARLRVARGIALLALGAFVLAQPTLAVQIVAVLGGCGLLYFGAGEVLSATVPAEPRVRRPRPSRRRVLTSVAAAAACVAGIAIGFALTGGARRVNASTVFTCNGYAQLCNRRLDEVVFAGTHNSMSAADSRGWLIANQDRKIAEQLQDGIRFFKISTHYAVKSGNGLVQTDISAEGARVNRVAAKLDPRARDALQRLSGSVANGPAPGQSRDIWLCHTLCELGATRMVDFLGVIHRFLELNPHQVIMLFDEDYVSERDLRRAFKRAGLFRNLATLKPGQPLPTLAELIRAHRNVIVFAQKEISGKYPWNTDGFAWVQDTPLGATKPSQFTCRLSRGRPGNPLLMMNNWADLFPPRLTPNLPLVKRSFILQRARQCVMQRGRLPNLILTDYYDRGDVVGAVASLNGVADQRPAATTPVGS